MTNAELAILSLVAEQPRHGYDIEQTIEARGMREWTEIGFSSIYYILKKLDKSGLVVGRLEQAERGPPRRIYTITPEGEDELRKALLDVLSNPQHTPRPVMLGIGNLPAVPPDEAVAALRRYYDTLDERRRRIRTAREQQQPLPYFVDALFDYSLMMIRAEMDWLASFIDQLKKRLEP